MRDLLTGLAAFLIVLLTAALAAPYFIDWNAQRGFVEARLSHALKQKVTIGGAIDLKLLPTPYLVLDQAVIGSDEGPVRLGIRHLVLELSVTPLLHGEFEVVEAVLEEPVIRVNLRDDHSLPPLPDAPAFRADVRFDRIAISGGTLAIADPGSGYTFVVDHLDLEAAAGSLAGPFKGTGEAGAPATRTKFRFAASAAQDGKTHARLVVDETRAHAGLDLDGTLSMIRAGHESLRERFDGAAAVSGHFGDGAALVLPWRLAGPIHADPSGAGMKDGEFRIGAEEHGLALAATGEAVFADTPRLHVGLTGKQLDMDRLFGGGISPNGAAVKPSIPSVAALRRAFATASPPVPVAADVAIESAILDGETLSGLKTAFVLGGSGAQPLRFSGDGPGPSHLALAGTLSPGAKTDFDGLFDVSSGNAGTTAAWLATIAPDYAPAGQDIPVRTASAKGHIAFGDGGFSATGLLLRLDRSILTGTAGFQPTRNGRPALFKANLHADALDVDALPDLDLSRPMRNYDLDLHLDARAIKVASLGGAPADAGRIQIGLLRSGPNLTLDPFKIEGVGGAAIAATAHFDPRGGSLDAKLDADKLTDVAGLLKRLAPGSWADALANRADALAPAKLSLGAQLKPGPDGGLALSSASSSGTVGNSRFEAALTPDAARPGNVTGRVSISAREGSALLRQIGLPALPLDNLGASQVTLALQGPLGGPLDAVIHAGFGATSMEGNGHVTLDPAHPDGAGTVKLTSPDASPLLQSMAIAFPDFFGRIPVDLESHLAWRNGGLALNDLSGHAGGSTVSGAVAWRSGAKPALTGALRLDRLSLETLVGLALGPAQPAAASAIWSNLPFGTGLIDPPSARLDLKTRFLDLGEGQQAQDAALGLEISPGLVAVRNLTARVDGGTLKAGFDLRRDGATASLEGKIALNGVKLDLPSAQGTLDAALDIAGGGRTPLALIASLAGTGNASIGDLQIPGADPAALPKVFAEVEADRLAVDEATLTRALETAGRGSLAAGHRRFTLSLAAGILHFDEPRDAASPAAPPVSAALDLRQASIEERIEETLTAIPQDWQGPPPRVAITLAGPLKAPRRATDLGGFVNALAGRALARETARIEAYEFDVRERAFFNQRLKSEHARAEDQRAKILEEQRAKALDEQLRARPPLQLQLEPDAGTPIPTSPAPDSDMPATVR